MDFGGLFLALALFAMTAALSELRRELDRRALSAANRRRRESPKPEAPHRDEQPDECGPSPPSEPNEALRCYQCAQAHQEAGYWEQAVADYTRAIELHEAEAEPATTQPLPRPADAPPTSTPAELDALISAVRAELDRRGVRYLVENVTAFVRANHDTASTVASIADGLQELAEWTATGLWHGEPPIDWWRD